MCKRKQIRAAFLFFPSQLQICARLIAWTARGDMRLKTCQLSTWQRLPHIIFVIFFSSLISRLLIHSQVISFICDVDWSNFCCHGANVWQTSCGCCLIAVKLPFSVTEHISCSTLFWLNFWLQDWFVSTDSVPHLTPASTPGCETLPAVLLWRERETRRGRKPTCRSLTFPSGPGLSFLTPHGTATAPMFDTD